MVWVRRASIEVLVGALEGDCGVGEEVPDVSVILFGLLRRWAVRWWLEVESLKLEASR